VDLIGDPRPRQRLRREIATKARAHLDDRMNDVRGFEDFALRAVAEAGGGADD
jgi:hypothetical protein